MLPQPVGLLKLMLNLFPLPLPLLIMFKGENSTLGDQIMNTFHTGLSLDGHEWKMLDTTEIYSFIQDCMTLTFAQGHRLMRLQEHVLPY